MTRTRLAAAAVALSCLVWETPQAGTLRPLTPEDLLALEVAGDWWGGGFEFSGDGRQLAFVWQRPQVDGALRRGVWDERRMRVLVTPAEGGVAVDLAHDTPQEDGYWLPVWSPDDAFLAVLSTRKQRQHLWLWERATGHLKQATSFDVARVGAVAYVWLDNKRLLVASAADDGEAGSPSWSALRHGPRIAMDGWRRAWTGTQVTASVLDSGRPVDHSTRPHQRLLIVGVDGSERTLDTALGFHALKPAPGLRHVAYMKSVTARPPHPDKPVRHFGGRLGTDFSGSRYTVGVIDRDGRPVPLPAAAAGFAAPNSLSWSPDGKRFAYIGVLPQEEDGPCRLFEGSVSGAFRQVALPGLDPQSVMFGADGRMLVSARPVDRREGVAPRTDWWSVAGGRAPENLTAHFKQPPATVYPGVVPAAVAVADGALWRLDLKTLRWKAFPANGSQISRVAWPGDGRPGSAASTADPLGHVQLIVAGGEAGERLFRVDIAAGTMDLLARPTPLARPAAHFPRTNTTVFVGSERTGTTVSLVSPRGRLAVREANGFLGGIAEGERRLIDYRGSDGQALKAQLILPVGYVEGQRYPVVTSVYAGSMVTDVNSGISAINFAHPLNAQLFAARGYAVLRPSMPLPPEPDGDGVAGSDPYMELTKGVLPALDRLIELGIADPDRIAVTGQSFGGFSTYGLITQTRRFRAAIAMAGPSDFVSGYGIFMADERYKPYPHETTFRQSLAETSQTRMGNPPWKDWGRYLRNSPLFHVDRVQTPVLITQGDLDYVSIQQGEEFFSALYRQGKRARFVRYWGEGHVLDSPANIVDLWRQIYVWLEEEMAPRAADR